ncbi:hypothetical protein GW793_02000 [bacterium]|uniref:Elongation factor P C-terminal domain-containing protein n=2 Tax=Katanobacteria TaxID=422282 RepID=A0A2M7X4S3_UNCKA|nr:hypothetical protein [bacterium]PIP56125.1 MAG: hypothetical protein COX05_04705 [candidate division WWE3 bacterium CG22_combo_CG10-13_8_21_14_all_39_12]PJA41174.1 MAG: hypothetical protein CO179_00460 [candidate division WWE3 bacterium CG_4_9_14_3_um_filter_39_7]
MIDANSLRQGVVFEQNGSTFQVVEFRRHKTARAKGIVNVKAKNVATGNTQEFSFKSGESVQEGSTVTVSLEFVYHDQRKGELTFSDPETKKRFTLQEDVVDSTKRGFLVSGLMVKALLSSENIEKAQVYEISLPNTIEAEVVEAPPNDKGDSSAGSTKPVTIKSGAVVNTPFFIKVGDIIKVNTETGQYSERVVSG